MIDSSDYYLTESYQITVGVYQSEVNWKNKAILLENYRDSIGFKILSVTTSDEADNYSEEKFFYSWYSALLYNYKAAGWGEYLFSSDDNSAVYRTRPVVSPGTYYFTEVIDASPVFYRNTDTGQISINTETHACGFTPDS